MKNKFFVVICVFCVMVNISAVEGGNHMIKPVDIIKQDLEKMTTQHPRLLCKDFQKIKHNYQTHYGKMLGDKIIYDANLLFTEKTKEYVKSGRRLLSVSRAVLYRVNTLSIAWILTDDDRYFERAKEEIFSACRFQDWNPSHFLDVGEMALAIAIGYDFFYDKFTKEEREFIKKTLIEKALLPGFDEEYSYWWKMTNNWSPVCHTGLVAASLAIYPDRSDLATKVITRAVENVPKSMVKSYGDDGTYPEGVLYWQYGSKYNTMLCKLLEEALGTDYELSSLKGFELSGEFVQHCTSPLGLSYAYSDGKNKFVEMSFATLYLIKKFNRPDFFDFHMKKSLETWCQNRATYTHRLNPLMMLDIDKLPDVISSNNSSKLYYFSNQNSLVPIGVIRSSHENDATYLAMKGGAPNVPHGHMDSGSFVIEMNGMRIAEDLGKIDYGPMEAKGVQIWGLGQNSKRWEVFQLGVASHNIVVIDGENLTVSGKAIFKENNANSMSVDLSKTYQTQVQSFTRKGSVAEEKITLQDIIMGVKANSKIRWQMCTPLEIVKIEDNELILQGDKGKIKLIATTSGKWSYASVLSLLKNTDERPKQSYNMVYYEVMSPLDGYVNYTISIEEVKYAN